MNDNITYRDRKIWSDLWIKIYDRLEFLRTNADYRSYKRAVTGLINRLYKKERQTVIEYMINKDKELSDYTLQDLDEITVYIQDLLEEAGYIKYTGDNSIPVGTDD